MGGELRFDVHTGEWVSIVGHRQARPNLPSHGCPFCVGGLEAPNAYETAWFVNRWPAYEPGPPVELDEVLASGARSATAVGSAEVILYSPQHDGSLGSLGDQQVRKVIDIWAERTEALLARPEVSYVLVFESRGAEVGATLHHPHGQIYAFPFVPPSPRDEAEATRSHRRCLVCEELERELHDARRVIYDDGNWVAWVPFASPHCYGLRLASRTHTVGLPQLTNGERDSLATALVDVLSRYDRMWPDDPNRSEIFPYLMWVHQAPAVVEDPNEWHVHFHFAPPQRSAGVHRYIAAGEVGSGTMSNPVIPEDAAAVLRSV